MVHQQEEEAMVVARRDDKAIEMQKVDRRHSLRRPSEVNPAIARVEPYIYIYSHLPIRSLSSIFLLAASTISSLFRTIVACLSLLL